MQHVHTGSLWVHSVCNDSIQGTIRLNRALTWCKNTRVGSGDNRTSDERVEPPPWLRSTYGAALSRPPPRTWLQGREQGSTWM